MINYRENFKKELDRLNPKQREAVEHIEGPSLVIAGPGTGKTQILAARIGYILENTDTRPENILCLTYTEAGAISMRQRVLQFIGPDAYKVSIYTFHAFCNILIQQNREAFGMNELTLLSDLEMNRIVRKIIDDFPVGHPLKMFGNKPYFYMSSLKRLFSDMKKEGWTPAHIRERCETYLASLPEREEYIYKVSNKKKGFKPGDIKQDKINKEADSLKRTIAGAEAFITYQEIVSKTDRYDFDDMLLWVHNAFSRNKGLLLDYQERYQYFLVDEFQDNNGIQTRILNQLTDYWDNPNVFVVGDDDQSVYRFQGAQVENIIKFKEQYGDHAKVTVLTENYRSSQAILDAAGELISHNEERLVKALPGLSKQLTASGENKSFTEVPEIRQYPSIAYETVHVASEIMRLKEGGVPPKEIAVIYRKHRQAEDLARYLEANGVQVNLRRRANVLDSPIVQKVEAILRYINTELHHPHKGEDQLFRILHFDVFDISPLAIARLSAEIGYKRREGGTFWREELQKIEPATQKDLFAKADDDASKIRNLSDDFEYWISESVNITLQQLVEKIVTRGGFLSYTMQARDKMWLMQELVTFFDFVRNETDRNPRLSLHELLKTMSEMRADDIELQLTKISYAEEGMNLMTAHASKGLEFDHVFVIGCNKNMWETSGGWGNFKLPDNLVQHYAAEPNEQEESRRLFYVAVTRARKVLYVSYAGADQDMVEQEKSRFVAEFSATLGDETVISVPDSELMRYNEALIKEQQPHFVAIEADIMRARLENYRLSASHLNTYLKCPRSFYFQYVLRVPTAGNEAMAFGNAVHTALEKLFYKLLKSENKTFAPLPEFIADFERAMHGQRADFTDEQFKRRLEFGLDVLAKYYNHHLPTWNKIISPEKNFSDIVVDGVPLRGKVDKIEFDGNDATVVDYKTGFPTSSYAEEKLAPITGDYWRQAIFYRILVDNAGRNWKFKTARIEFIQPDDDGNFLERTIEAGDPETTMVREQIVRVYNSIKNLEFDNGCEKPDCEWCRFVKSNYASVGEGVVEQVE